MKGARAGTPDRRKPAAWKEARARVAEHPEEITVVYLADGDERSAVWSNRPDIVFGADR